MMACSLFTGDFLSKPMNDIELNSYITTLKMPTSEGRCFSDAVDEIVQLLYTSSSLSIQEIYKGGSLKKGTGLKNRSDVDLVVFLNGVDSISDLQRNMSSFKDQIKSALSCSDKPYCNRQFEKTTKFSVQVTLRPKSCCNITVKVDILPSLDIVRKKGGLPGVYREMQGHDPVLRRYYSAALTKQQAEFIKHQPPGAKDLIILAKHWGKDVLPRTSNKWYPTSYFYEVLSVHVYEKAAGSNFDVRRGFKTILYLLRNPHNLDVNWDYSLGINVEKPPRVMDPANPFNNLYNSVTAWDEVRSAAKKDYTCPLLKHVAPYV
ncbi:2'-5'-oligoadenylate synthase 2-like [Tubulanus polymorphus]|uniref:2'-5'-oligoadenylate synthase 2-like n=1 Tax=Tubulanus polymorphus TaxID=672921 RepID=UPI003DA64A4E